MSEFAHLHVHTEYSLLDGMSRIKNLVSHAKELGMDSLAITDHGAMYGVIEFYRACKAEEVRPIIGLEAYMAPRGMTDRHGEKDKNYTHLLLLAQNQAGYQNLLKIASASMLDGFYYKPRIDHEFLAAHAEGIICTSGCMAAEIPQMILQGREEDARQQLGWYLDIFGPDRFYIELQEHDIPELHKLNKALLDLAPYAEVPLLATNDVHYVRKEDANPHDVLLCIGTSSLVSETKRLKFSDDSYYLRSPQEMAAIFGSVPEAISNTLKIAEMCEVNLDDRSYKLPKFEVPEGFDPQSYLRHLCDEGLRWRYQERANETEIQQRLEHELRIINNMGFDAYFLIVWDLCVFAREADIWWNVRGSGAGSVVAYALGITNIDPLENNLIFERFLNPGRVNMPDIDLDYPDDRRAEMIEYCVKKYGADKVAQIITFGTLGARAAIRDVGRTLDIPLSEVDQLARMIPAVPGKSVTIEKALEDIPDLSDAYNDRNRPYIRNLLDTARQLEGISRHASTHAAGVLISDKPLVEYTPLARASQNAVLESASQWPMEIVDSIGLLKVDFLGLRTLTIMRKACELIEKYHGAVYSLDNIPYRHIPGDEEYNSALDKAFDLLTAGNTSGVFQVEGAGMTRTLMDMQPSRFEHIIAAISLFRPGPLEYIPTYIRRMHGEEDVTYHHPKLELILAETYGIIVYQEQIMQIASSLFGYELGEADLMRRAVAKKKKKELDKHKAKFQKQGPENDVPPDVAEAIFNDIEFFARYGFNKSHAADYAVLTVQTAFLKAHYPHEYMTALLTIERGDTDKVGFYINDCRQMGIDVLPPDIHASDHDFIIEDQPDGRRSIRYGLSAIKNVGEGSVDAILAGRGGQPYANLQDFCKRTDMRAVGKRALECLIKVGALDSFGDRVRLLNSLDRFMNYSTGLHKAAEVGQMSLFGEATGVELALDAGGILVDEVTTDVSRREMLQWERDLVGVYVSEHPLQAVMNKLESIVTVNTSQLSETDHDRSVTMAGVVKYVRPHVTKNGKPMAFASIEDLYGEIEVLIWPSTWDETRDLWVVDRILLIRGKLDIARGEPKLLCEDATTNFSLWETLSDNRSQHLPRHQRSGEYNGYDASTAPDPYHDALPPDYYNDDPPSYEDPPPNLPPASPASPRNGHGHIGHAGNGANSNTSASLPDEDSVIGASTASIAAARSNSASIQAQNELSSAPPVPIVPSRQRAETRHSLHLRITVNSSGDPEVDKRKMQRIFGKLIHYPGDDTFSFVLIRNGQAVEINFSNETTHHCQTLIDELMLFVSEEAIQIIEG